MLARSRRALTGPAAIAAAALLAAGCTSSSNPSSAQGSSTGASPGSSSAGASTGSPTTNPSAAPAPPDLQSLQGAFVSVVSRVLPSVVEINTDRGLGSGIVFNDKGYIVTNDHVVAGASTYQVRLSSGATSLPATLVGSYPPDDLAVIKVSNASGLQPATFADSSKVRVGDIVLAMGNPLGLASSVTEGIVSATGRTVTEPKDASSPGATLPNVIQTSAAINPGNSGGALVSLSGQVVGIPTLAATDQQLGGAAPGIGFAIPSNVVTDIAQQLVDHGKVVNSHRAALGVTVVTVSGPDGAPAGVGVVKVEAGGPAASAGIAAGDVINAINGNKTPDTQTLSVVLASMKPGDKVTVEVTKAGGSQAKVAVTLGQLNGG
ncbi:MAG TPA: trypsin-like peptidase domain-containing protein [Acidothermaceae bacterium]|jgi:S1-C subfamily serine protease